MSSLQHNFKNGILQWRGTSYYNLWHSYIVYFDMNLASYCLHFVPSKIMPLFNSTIGKILCKSKIEVLGYQLLLLLS